MTTNSLTGQISAIKLIVSLLPEDRLVTLTTQWTPIESGISHRWVVCNDRMTVIQRQGSIDNDVVVRTWKSDGISVREWFLAQLTAIRASTTSDAKLVILA
jgi:hypothetical protein